MLQTLENLNERGSFRKNIEQQICLEKENTFPCLQTDHYRRIFHYRAIANSV